MHNSRRMFRNDEPEQQETKIPLRSRLLANLVGSQEYQALKEVAAEYGAGHAAPLPGTLQDGFRYLVSKVIADTINQLFLLVEHEAELVRKAMEE